MGTVDRLLKATEDIWASYHEKPFVQGLKYGTLDQKKFRSYIIQDYWYLMDYTKVFAIGVAKSKSVEVMKLFAKYIQAILDGEVNVHNGYMADFGITQEELDHTPIQQDNRSYTSYMLSVAYRGGEAEILTAIFSCAYSYEVIARKIVEECPSAPEHPMYGRWVRGYITPRYTGNNVILKDMLERLTKDYTEEQLRYLEEIFTACSRYEASFWDMADRFGTTDLVRRRCFSGGDPHRHRLCAFGYGQGSGGDRHRSHHRLRHDASGGPHRRPHRPQRHGDRENELWTEGRLAVRLPERASAGRLDCHHDL